MLVTSTLTGVIATYRESSLTIAPTTISYGWFPSRITSFTPVTTTVCAAFQSSGVKVRLLTPMLPSVKSLDERLTVTPAVGFESSTAVNVASVPDSVVGPLIGLSVIPTGLGSRKVTLGCESHPLDRSTDATATNDRPEAAKQNGWGSWAEARFSIGLSRLRSEAVQIGY